MNRNDPFYIEPKYLRRAIGKTQRRSLHYLNEKRVDWRVWRYLHSKEWKDFVKYLHNCNETAKKLIRSQN